MYRSSTVITFRFNSKTQMAELSGRHDGAPPIQSFINLSETPFSNKARMKSHTDLNLGEVVHISIIYHIPDFSLNLLNGYDFYF